MSKKYLLLGESPNPATDGRPELWLLPDNTGVRHSANLLLERCGLTLEQYLGLFARDNVLHQVPPPDKRGGFSFPLDQARQQAGRVMDLASEHAGMVVLGRRASRVFHWYRPSATAGRRHVARDHLAYFNWYMASASGDPMDSSVRATVVPHPSGINRWWNRSDHRFEAERFFKGLLDGGGS